MKTIEGFTTEPYRIILHEICLVRVEKWSVTLGQNKLDINSWMSVKWEKLN
jgi:hypothetical protein